MTILTLPSSQEMVYNIMKIYEQATAAEVINGKLWYFDANQLVIKLSVEFGYNPAAVACALSALSPRNSWENNKKDLRMILASRIEDQETVMPWDAADLKNYRYMAFAANVEKANRILDQNSDDIAEAVKLVGKGLKTINFALLCYSDFLFSRTAICVDTHAIGVALGRRLSPKETSAVFASEKKYTEIKMAYMRASEKVRGLRGSQMQAITWLTWKRIHAI